MNNKLATVTLAAAAAFSSNVFAGELYAPIERDSSAASSVQFSVPAFETSLAVSGALYPEAYAAVDNAVASNAERQAYVTTLAVGGELGTPNRDSQYGSSITEGAFAE